MKHFWKYWKIDSEIWEPWRTEWEVWHEPLKLAGSIDMVYKHRTNGTYAIYDWKRTKEIKMDNPWQSGLGPVSHLPDCNLWHYTLQLNSYKWLLEANYGIKISEMALIVLHPDNSSFKRYILHSLDEEIEAMMETRRQALLRGKGEVVYFGEPEDAEDADPQHADAEAKPCFIED
jgi:hypothetical protein